MIEVWRSYGAQVLQGWEVDSGNSRVRLGFGLFLSVKSSGKNKESVLKGHLCMNNICENPTGNV